VLHVEPDGITIKFSGGISKIPCEEITKADQQRFNCCDPQKAVAYAAEQAASIGNKFTIKARCVSQLRENRERRATHSAANGFE
jgi:hypothetical protein